MAAEDYFDPYAVNLEDFADSDEDFEVDCKHCGRGGLTWETDGVRYYLVDRLGKKHVCKRVDPKVKDDFKVIT